MGLDTVELIMQVENQFDIQIPDNDAENLATVQQLSDYTFDKIKETPNNKVLSKNEVETSIRKILEVLTGIPLNQIKMTDAFTNDLGMD